MPQPRKSQIAIEATLFYHVVSRCEINKDSHCKGINAGDGKSVARIDVKLFSSARNMRLAHHLVITVYIGEKLSRDDPARSNCVRRLQLWKPVRLKPGYCWQAGNKLFILPGVFVCLLSLYVNIVARNIRNHHQGGMEQLYATLFRRT